MPPDLLHELYIQTATNDPQRTAIITVDGERISFESLHHRVESLGSWLSEVSAPGDRIAVVADNCDLYLTLYYAIPRHSRVLVLINQRYSPREQAEHIRIAEPSVLLGQSHYVEALDAELHLIPSLRHVVTFDSIDQVDHSPADSSVEGRPSVEDPAWMLFTGGSTGRPKCVVHTHGSLAAAVWGAIEARGLSESEVFVQPFPMCHIGGYYLLAYHAVGAAVLPLPRFRPGEFVDVVNEQKGTFCSVAPTMLRALLDHLDATGRTMPTLRGVAYGSSPMPPELIRRANDVLGVDFYQSYGQTETGGAVTFLSPADHRAGLHEDETILKSAGRAHRHVDVEIMDDSGTLVPRGSVGEVVVRGAQTMAGYWRDAEATESATSNGWLRTGDIGRLDDQGRLFILDRVKDMIISGGENIASPEVEEAMSSHPGVATVAVVGVPDDYWGEAVCAVVVPVAGANVTANELIAHVRERISSFKRPRHVLFVSELPMTTIGKVDKRAARDFARSELAAG